MSLLPNARAAGTNHNSTAQSLLIELSFSFLDYVQVYVRVKKYWQGTVSQVICTYNFFSLRMLHSSPFLLPCSLPTCCHPAWHSSAEFLCSTVEDELLQSLNWLLCIFSAPTEFKEQSTYCLNPFTFKLQMRKPWVWWGDPHSSCFKYSSNIKGSQFKYWFFHCPFKNNFYKFFFTTCKLSFLLGSWEWRATL